MHSRRRAVSQSNLRDLEGATLRGFEHRPADSNRLNRLIRRE